MVAADLAPSPELVEANRRLYELRERVQADKALAVRPGRLDDSGHRPCLVVETRSLIAGLPAGLPAHLGWESAAITKAIRTSRKRRHEENTRSEVTKRAHRPEARAIKARAIDAPAPAISNSNGAKETVKLYPDIALGMLHKDLTAAGRIWLLLRYLDQDGRGWLRIDLIQKKLTAKDSNLRVCGRRHLRNLLQQGRGVFWDRDKDKVWLKSAAKVAAALDVARLSGHPVKLSVPALLGGIGQVRAHFYASFHSGRKSGNPISRSRLEEITQVPERTQRVYDQIAGVSSQRNIAVGEKYSNKEVQEQAWQHGQATFKFFDTKGKQGPAGRHYLAWRLPNSYQGCHQPSPRGRQKKINNRLNHQIDLVILGAQGNGLDRRIDRLFHTNGMEASKAYNRNSQDDIYWSTKSATKENSMTKSSQLWQVIPGRDR
jgi:hypothetical protein